MMKGTFEAGGGTVAANAEELKKMKPNNHHAGQIEKT